MSDKTDEQDAFINLAEMDDEGDDDDQIMGEVPADSTVPFFSNPLLQSTPVKTRPDLFSPVKSGANSSISNHLSHSEGDLSRSFGLLDVSSDDRSPQKKRARQSTEMDVATLDRLQTPVYCQYRLSNEEILALLTDIDSIDQSKVCNRIPVGPPGTGQWTFLVNLESVEVCDLAFDGMGSWGKPGGRTLYYRSEGDKFKRVATDKMPEGNWDFRIKCNRYNHPGAKNGKFGKMIFVTEKQDKSLNCQFAVICYDASIGPSEVKIVAHKTAKDQEKPMPRTKRSVFQKQRQLLPSHTPHQVNRVILQESGGVSSIYSPVDVPANQRQIRNQSARNVPNSKRITRAGRPAMNKYDELEKMMSHQGSFVRAVEYVPATDESPMCIRVFVGDQRGLEVAKISLGGDQPGTSGSAFRQVVETLPTTGHRRRSQPKPIIPPVLDERSDSVIDPVNVKVKTVNAKKPVNKMKKSCHDESGDELGSQKDVFHLYGYPDCISDFSDSEDMKKESVLKAIGKKKDFLRRNRKTVLHNDENRKFQDRMRKHTIGQYQVHVNYLKSAHDSERKALVDRPLDDAHVQYIKENAREYPRLGMVSGTWLGLYNGTAQEFSDQDKEISKKNARRLRDRAQNKGTSKDPITMLDPVSGADVQDTLTVIGGNHRLAAFTQLAEEHQNNEQEIIERFTSGVLRIIIVVIVTKYVNPHDPSDVDILDDNDVSKLAREHNCNPRELSKVFFDRVMSLRRAALSQANMPNVDLSISLPPTWTRRDTDIAFKEFCSKEFRQGKSDPAAQQLSKAKHLVEQPGTYFQDLKHMHEECRRISGLYFKQNEKTLADGEKIGMEFNLITVANVGRPLAPLATRTQHKLISQLRVKLDALVKTIDDNEFGVKPQLMALIDAFKKKCEKERRRQIFMYGLSVATGVAASKLIETFGSYITDDSNYVKYLPDLESFKSKKPAVKELPPSFQNFYTRVKKKLRNNSSVLEHKLKKDKSGMEQDGELL